MKMPNVFNGFIDASSRLDTLALFFARLLSGSPLWPAWGGQIACLARDFPRSHHRHTLSGVADAAARRGALCRWRDDRRGPADTRPGPGWRPDALLPVVSLQ